MRDPRASLHVPGRDFFNFAVVAGPTSLAVAQEPEDDAVEKLFEIHLALGATSKRDGFGEDMLTNHRMAVSLHVEHIYGQILDQGSRRGTITSLEKVRASCATATRSISFAATFDI